MCERISIMNLWNCAKIKDTLGFAVASGKVQRLCRVHSGPLGFRSQSALSVFECKFLTVSCDASGSSGQIEKERHTLILDRLKL